LQPNAAKFRLARSSCSEKFLEITPFLEESFQFSTENKWFFIHLTSIKKTIFECEKNHYTDFEFAEFFFRSNCCRIPQ